MRYKGSLWVPEHDGIRPYRRIPPGLPLVDPLRCPPLPDVGRMPPLQCAIAIVTSVLSESGDNNNVTSSSLNTTGASLIALVVSSSTGGDYTVSDSKSNTWSPLTAQNEGVQVGCRMYYAVNPTVGASHTFTVTKNSGANLWPSVAVIALSGAHTTAPFDAENGAVVSLSGSLATGSVSPSENNEIVISGMAFSTNTSATVDSPMTMLHVAPSTANWGTGLAYEIQTAATARNTTFNAGGTSRIAAVTACFKAAAAGGFVPFPRPRGELGGMHTLGGGVNR